MTDAENKLWYKLRRIDVGAKFRRQHPYDRYIIDFVCLERYVIVEVDGSQHADSRHDEARDAFLVQAGFTILRFDNLQVLLELDAVLDVIYKALTPSPPQPSP